MHQPLAQRRIGDSEGFERKIERLAGHLPEIGVAVLYGAQPSVLQLLVAPHLREPRCRLATDHIAAPLGSRGAIEQGAVGVEDTSAGAAQLLFAHSAARRFFGFGHRVATNGNTSSTSRRVCASISRSPRAAGLRMNFDMSAVT